MNAAVSWLKAILLYWAGISTGLLVALLLAYLGLAYGFKAWPRGIEWFIFVAPLSTLAVAVFSVVKFLHKIEHKPGATVAILAGYSIGIVLVAFAACVAISITVGRGWFCHLIFPGGLFLAFWLWDRGVLMHLQDPGDEEIRAEVAVAHKVINMPTFLTFTALLLLLWIIPDAPLREFLKEIGLGAIPQGHDPPPGLENAKDAFAMGAVAFHMFASSLAYGISTVLK